jgi:hypothetical protein
VAVSIAHLVKKFTKSRSGEFVGKFDPDRLADARTAALVSVVRVRGADAPRPHRAGTAATPLRESATESSLEHRGARPADAVQSHCSAVVRKCQKYKHFVEP